MTESIPRNVSLNDIGLRYMSALQRLSDLAVFSWAGSRAVNEQSYEELSRTIPGLPSTEFHLPLNVAKEEAERWNVKHTANEVLGLAMVFLDEVRRICALVAFNAARANGFGDLVTLAAEFNSPPNLPDPLSRFNQLREHYGVVSSYEAEILSLAAFARFLFQTNGVIAADALPFTLRLKAIYPPAEGESQPRVADFERSWSAGERLTLTREEQATIFTTVSLYFGNLLKSLQEYAKNSGLPVTPPNSAR